VAVLPKAHPLGQQCQATAKATGRRCERRVVAANVCYVHGLNAKQTRGKRDQRLALWEVQEARAAEPAVLVQKEPEELLLAALHDVNQVLQQIKADLHGGSVNPILLQLAGDWLDRLARIGKVVTDGDLSRKLYERVGVQAQDLASQLTAMLAAILQAAPLTAQQRLAVWESRFDGLQSVADGRAPSRMLGDATVRFTDELKVAAAREQALAEGLPWDELKPDPDSDGADTPLVVSGANGDGFRG
jgi:hypothetical protein